MSEFVGKVCPFCKTEIKEEEAVKVCPACGIAHHESCWVENKGCTTFGCSEQHYEPQHTSPTSVCANCGAPMGETQAFCPQCGTPKAAPKKSFCGKCGYELKENQGFCPQCGQKVGVAIDPNVNAAIHQFNAGVQQTKTKKSIAPVLIAVGVVAALIILIAVIIGASGPKVDSISLEYSAVELRLDEYIIVDYDILPVDSADADVQWSSSNSRVASVSSTGKISAVGEGTCTITAKAGNQTDTITVTVVAMTKEEEQMLGTWDVVGFFQDGEIETLPSYTSHAYMYDDMSGKLTVGDTTLNFTWEYNKSDEKYIYFNGTVSDGGSMPIVYMKEYGYLVFNLGEMQVIFDR